MEMVEIKADSIPGISAWCVYEALCIPDSNEIGAEFAIPLLALLLMMTMLDLTSF